MVETASGDDARGGRADRDERSESSFIASGSILGLSSPLVAGEPAFENDAWHAAMPFGKLLGAELVAGGKDEVRARLAWAPELCTAGGVLHGGAIMGLADGAAGTCAFLNLPDGATGTATISSSTSFLRAVRSGHVEAIARPLRAGRSVVVVETDVVDAEGNLVARVVQSQAVLR